MPHDGYNAMEGMMEENMQMETTELNSISIRPLSAPPGYTRSKSRLTVKTIRDDGDIEL